LKLLVGTTLPNTASSSESRNALTGIETHQNSSICTSRSALSESRNALTGIETFQLAVHGSCKWSESRNALTGIETHQLAGMNREQEGSESRNALTGIETHATMAPMDNGLGLNQEMP